MDPEDKTHERFHEVRDVKIILLDRHVQEAGQNTTKEMTVDKAVEDGVIANETLGYFVARIYLFLLKIGINPERLRFRQHMGIIMLRIAGMPRYTIPLVGLNVLGVLIERPTIFLFIQPELVIH